MNIKKVIIILFFILSSNFSFTKINRIISLAPSITELIYYIEEQNKLIGVTRYCNYPPEVTNKTIIGGIIDVNIEEIIKLNPDLVIASYSGNSKEKVERIESFGIKTLTLKENNIYDVISNIIKLCIIFNKNYSNYIIPLINTISNSYFYSNNKKKYIYLISISPLYTISTNSFISDALNICGFENLIKSKISYPTIDKEILIILKPDYVLINDNFKNEENYIKNIFKSIKQNPKIIFLPTDIMSRPSPRLIFYLPELKKIK